jgi:hypothetical protein
LCPKSVFFRDEFAPPFPFGVEGFGYTFVRDRFFVSGEGFGYTFVRDRFFVPGEGFGYTFVRDRFCNPWAL